MSGCGVVQLKGEGIVALRSKLFGEGWCLTLQEMSPPGLRLHHAPPSTPSSFFQNPAAHIKLKHTLMSLSFVHTHRHEQTNKPHKDNTTTSWYPWARA